MPIATRAQILVADDHSVVRMGLRAILDAEPDLRVVAEATDGAGAVRLGLSPDVHLAVLDIAMPRLTGLQAARELSQRRPGLRMIMLSMYDKEQYFFEAIAVGASGYVLKRAADREIVRACRAALRGESFRYPMTEATREGLATRHPGPGELVRSPLTQRESEIVKLIAPDRSLTVDTW